MTRVDVAGGLWWVRCGSWLAAALVTVVTVADVARAQGSGGRTLFAPSARSEDGTPGRSDRTKKRSRRVRAEVSALTAADSAGGGDVLTLNLFDDVRLRARRQGTLERTAAGGTIWRGRLLDTAGEAVFAINGDVMAATVFAEGRVFEILYAGEGDHVVHELEPSAFPTDDPPLDTPPTGADGASGDADPATTLSGAADAASQIDVMVIWTPAARTTAGGTAAIQSLVDLAVAATNTSYGNSSVTQRLRLVYAGELAYTEGNISTDLGRLANTADGHLDAVHALRNAYGADVVTLVGDGYVAAGVCGIGYLMTSASSGFAPYAFNVVDRVCSGGNLTYAHELGHNMGLHHDPANASGAGAFSYAYGYQEPTGLFRTIMAYACPSGACPRLPRFSNPSLSYNGKPTGTVNHNNALALNNTAATVANFRQAVGSPCAFSLSATSISVGSGAASAGVGVSTTAGCNWTAISNAAWISVTSGGAGTGSGSVGFSVQANTGGTSRVGTLTVAGRTFTVTQAAATCGAFTLTPATQSIGASGGALSVSVTGTAGCSRTATSSASWIAVTAGTPATGSGTVTLSIAANLASSGRSGTVTIGGSPFVVTQAAAVCVYTISPASTTVTGSGGSGSFTLTTLSGCAAVATPSAAWITITSGASGTGTRTIGFSVAPNTGAARTGSIAVGGRAFAISQAAKTPGNRKAVNAAKADFNGDAMADLLWQHSNGAVALWTMDHLSATEVVFLNQVDPAWKMVGSGDLDGDGKPEIVWHHQTGGWLVAWFTDGRAVQQAVYLAPNRLDTAWTIAALADFNGDARADLVLQHADGRLGIWFMNGTTLAASASLTPSTIGAADWKIVGAGDLDGDAQADLLWLSGSGVIGAWLMDGTTARSTVLLNPSQVGAGWKVRGLVDLNDDDQIDVVWQHDAGMVGTWLMQGTTAASFEMLQPGAVGAGWRLVGPR